MEKNKIKVGNKKDGTDEDRSKRHPTRLGTCFVGNKGRKGGREGKGGGEGSIKEYNEAIFGPGLLLRGALLTG
jgi:hypothetical protein